METNIVSGAVTCHDVAALRPASIPCDESTAVLATRALGFTVLSQDRLIAGHTRIPIRMR